MTKSPSTWLAANAAAAVRRLTDDLAATADPAAAARLIELVTADGGVLEAVSDFLGAASRWTDARTDTAHLRNRLGRAGDEVYEAGADLETVPAELRALAARAASPSPARPRTAVVSAAPAAPRQAAPPPLRR
ncbi:hypothetical protein ACFVUH_08440 [Kitasatospora sp. NPDC058032]|uniref:hypothetical protein n=1 Tax=Kitasatospora sp. NPDC058032 TaxID=3346307 RepID=UPI0036DF7234